MTKQRQSALIIVYSQLQYIPQVISSLERTRTVAERFVLVLARRHRHRHNRTRQLVTLLRKYFMGIICECIYRRLLILFFLFYFVICLQNDDDIRRRSFEDYANVDVVNMNGLLVQQATLNHKQIITLIIMVNEYIHLCHSLPLCPATFTFQYHHLIHRSHHFMFCSQHFPLSSSTMSTAKTFICFTILLLNHNIFDRCSPDDDDDDDDDGSS